MKTKFLEQIEKTSVVQSFIKKVKLNNNKIILYNNIEKFNLKSKIKIVNKIKKILDKERIRQICIEKKIKDNPEFLNLLYSCNLKICSPKWIFIEKTDDIVSYVLKDKKREESEIYICVNMVDSKTEYYIYKFAKEFKKINIITNHIGKFRKIEQRLYQEEGIMINISNNRRKSLLKAKIILNVDFPNEILNKFAIYDYSTIISWEENLKINKKRFNGKIIAAKDLTVELNSEMNEFIDQFNLKNYDVRDICQVLEINPNGGIYISNF